MSCNGICERFKAKRNHTIPSRYKEGQKRCSVCEIFIKWDETYCPCCNYKLRYGIYLPICNIGKALNLIPEFLKQDFLDKNLMFLI